MYRKRSVYTTFHKNGQGFTLIELLIGLTIFSTILLLLPSVFKLVDLNSQTDEMAVRQFFHFATDEIQVSAGRSINNNRIQLITSNNNTVTISHYNQLIRRQVNGTGHEVLVRNITEFKVEPTQNGVNLKIQTTNGDVYEKTIIYY